MHHALQILTDRTSNKVLLVLDVVESVRLMEQDQEDFVLRWQQLVRQAVAMLPLYGGRIVKSLGDGLMLEFAQANRCITAAFALQALSVRANFGRRSGQQMHLRMGGHLASFVTDQHDIYGTDVNLTSRVCTLAGPNDVVISHALFLQLIVGVDAQADDLGECHLKHIKNPVRAYRVTPVRKRECLSSLSDRTSRHLKPNVAVIAFRPPGAGSNDTLVCEVLTERLLSAFARVPDVNIASGTPDNPVAVQAVGTTAPSRSPIDYIVVPSTTRTVGKKLILITELIDTRTGQALWSETSHSTEQEVLSGGEKLIAGLVAQLWVHIMRAELRRTATKRTSRSLIRPDLFNANEEVSKLGPSNAALPAFDQARMHGTPEKSPWLRPASD